MFHILGFQFIVGGFTILDTVGVSTMYSVDGSCLCIFQINSLPKMCTTAQTSVCTVVYMALSKLENEQKETTR